MAPVKPKLTTTPPQVKAPPPSPPPAPPKADPPKADANPVANDKFADPVKPPAGAGQTPPQKYDIMDDAALKALKASKKPEDKQTAMEIENARKSYAPLIKGGAKIYINRPVGNSGAPVLTMVPKALVDNPNQKFNTVVHYGGMHGTAANPDPSADSNKKIGAAINGTPPTVYILPEGKSPVKNPGRQLHTPEDYDPDWSVAKDPRATADDSLKAIGLKPTGDGNKLTVSAHSAGGRAVVNAIKNGKLDCDQLVLQDSLYQFKPPPAQTVLDWANTPAAANTKEIDYVHADGGNGDQGKMPKGLQLPNGIKFQRIEKPHHYDADFVVP